MRWCIWGRRREVGRISVTTPEVAVRQGALRAQKRVSPLVWPGSEQPTFGVPSRAPIELGHHRSNEGAKQSHAVFIFGADPVNDGFVGRRLHMHVLSQCARHDGYRPTAARSG
jgi:hypothetical protein